nr:hypothetical protein [Tanacetum cinerariifolium]
MASTSNRRGKAKTYEPWTTTEEIALCKAWCETMENYGTRDMKTGFWSEVFANFQKEIGGGGLFEDTMDENGSSDLVLFPNVLAEFQTGYGHPFTMKACWRILKNHEAWTEVEMPTYQRPDEHAICHGYLTGKEHQQLLFDEEAL